MEVGTLGRGGARLLLSVNCTALVLTVTKGAEYTITSYMHTDSGQGLATRTLTVGRD